VTKKKDPNLLPLRVHKATQQAYVLVDGTRHYLGRNGTPETQIRYDKFPMEWLARGRSEGTNCWATSRRTVSKSRQNPTSLISAGGMNFALYNGMRKSGPCRPNRN
jgi:hypothetical protein